MTTPSIKLSSLSSSMVQFAITTTCVSLVFLAMYGYMFAMTAMSGREVRYFIVRREMMEGGDMVEVEDGLSIAH